MFGGITSAVGGGAKKTVDNTLAQSEPNKVDTPTAAATTTKAAPTKAASSKAAAPKPAYAGALEGDRLAGGSGPPGGSVNLSGWLVTASKLERRSNALGPNLCSKVVMINRDDVQQEYSSLSWKLQTPDGDVQGMDYFSDADLSSGGLAPGGKVTKQVCFKAKSQAKGTYTLAWKPDIFSSQDRGIWLNHRSG